MSTVCHWIERIKLHDNWIECMIRSWEIQGANLHVARNRELKVRLVTNFETTIVLHLEKGGDCLPWASK